MITPLEPILRIVTAWEGGLSMDERDPGNWTGGKVGVGRLGGTNHGISAAAFPTLDIPALSAADAAAIYDRMYFRPLDCGSMPMPLAMAVFDACVNNGVGQSTLWLQRTVGATDDGRWGTASRAALARALGNGSPQRVLDLACEFHARRIHMMGSLPSWKTYGLGWSRRLAKILVQALQLAPDYVLPPNATPPEGRA